VFTDNSYYLLSNHQPVTCRSQLSYAVLAGIEFIELKTDIIVETFFSGIQDQGFRAWPVSPARKSVTGNIIFPNKREIKIPRIFRNIEKSSLHLKRVNFT
jgi:hypothetical protein